MTAREAFGIPTSYVTGFHPVALAVVDLDLDGHDDVVTANNLGNDVSVFLAMVGGTLEAPISFAAGDDPMGLVVSDLNRSGYPDIAVSNRNEFLGEPDDGTVTVLLQQFDVPWTVGLPGSPDEVQGLVFETAIDLSWDGQIGATHYEVARADDPLFTVATLPCTGSRDIRLRSRGAVTGSRLLLSGPGRERLRLRAGMDRRRLHCPEQLYANSTQRHGIPGHWRKPWTKKESNVSKKLETPPSRHALLIRWSLVRVLVGPFRLKC